MAQSERSCTRTNNPVPGLQQKIDRCAKSKDERERRGAHVLEITRQVMLKLAELHDAGQVPHALREWRYQCDVESAVRVVLTAERFDSLGNLNREQKAVLALMRENALLQPIAAVEPLRGSSRIAKSNGPQQELF
jgi:hypothetical protein